MKNIKKTPSVPTVDSIKTNLKEDENNKQDVNVALEKEVQEEFGLDDLKKVWNEFALKLKDSGKDSDFASLNGTLELFDKENIKLTIANKFQKVALENLKQGLLEYLRKELRNQFVNLEVEIRKVEEKELKYTNREKFEFLATKYPKLNELKQRLDLDPDF